MAEKFDPAPHDKHADDPREAARRNRETTTQLDNGLMDTFPASDPVSAQQPSVVTKRGRSVDDESADAHAPSLWDKFRSVFVR
ncbi:MULTISPECIES: hypothetical protein [unclassified Bradyrhizobium]|uniref:hypothetical protein n=1 Tax=unclassified Bradyrhizobium TaxID=2631580 RepID=UPI0028EB6AE9|nr:MULTISPECIES: hypothetical protein [unclassified Bradyrhizobium]